LKVADRIPPPDSTGRRLSDLIDDVRYLEVDEGPHNIGWTHPDEVNAPCSDSSPPASPKWRTKSSG